MLQSSNLFTLTAILVINAKGIVKHHGLSKVGDDDFPFYSKEEIAQLQITVNHAVLIQEHQST
jgi:hypothetical protein